MWIRRQETSKAYRLGRVYDGNYDNLIIQCGNGDHASIPLIRTIPIMNGGTIGWAVNDGVPVYLSILHSIRNWRKGLPQDSLYGLTVEGVRISSNQLLSRPTTMNLKRLTCGSDWVNGEFARVKDKLYYHTAMVGKYSAGSLELNPKLSAKAIETMGIPNVA